MTNTPSEERVWEILKGIKFPGMSRDIVSFGFVDKVAATAERVHVDLAISTGNPDAAERVRSEVEQALSELGPVQVEVGLEVKRPPSAAQQVAQSPNLIPEVQHVVAVASGKGGVGKSTVAINLAVKLGQLGYRVGLLDADIYGPSLPMMVGIDEQPKVTENRLIPFEKHGIKVMSLGFILDIDQPVIWRGPMVMKAIEQMLGDVEWGPLDFMIVDLPPGTGDAQLTISQRVPLSGAVIVTTPQDIALIDARKGLAMFQKVSVPVIGIIENMSGFACPHCGATTDVFKSGGGARTAEVLGCAFLGAVPLDPAIMQGGDAGMPVVAAQPDGAHGESFKRLAEAVVAEVSRQQRPKLSIF